MLKNRLATWRAIFAHPLVYWLGGIYGVVGLLDSVRAHILPVQYRDCWDRYSVMPDLSLQTWAIIGLAGTVLILLEGSYRLVKQQDKKHQAAIQNLRSELTEAQQKRDYRCISDKLAQLHEEGMQLLMRKVGNYESHLSWKKEIEDWYVRAQDEIEGSLSFSEMQLFRAISGPAADLFVEPFGPSHQQDLLFFGSRYNKLGIIIDDMNTRLR